MNGNKKLLLVLNSLLADDPTVVNQYLVQFEMCENLGCNMLIRILKTEEDHVDWAEKKHAQME